MSEQTQPKIEKPEVPSVQSHLEQAMEAQGAANMAELQRLQAAARGGYTDRIQLPANFSETAKVEIQKMEDDLQSKIRLRDEIAGKLFKAQAKKKELDGQISELTDTLAVVRRQTEEDGNSVYLKSCLQERQDRADRAKAINHVLSQAGLEGIVDMAALGLGPSPLDAAIKESHHLRRQKANAEAKAAAQNRARR